MDQLTLFDNEIPQPLAAKMRPEMLEEYVGQKHLLGRKYYRPTGQGEE